MYRSFRTFVLVIRKGENVLPVVELLWRSEDFSSVFFRIDRVLSSRTVVYSLSIVLFDRAYIANCAAGCGASKTQSLSLSVGAIVPKSAGRYPVCSSFLVIPHTSSS